MIRTIAYITLLLLLLAFGLTGHFTVQSGLGKIEGSIAEVFSAVEAGDWQRAEQSAQDAITQWNRRRAFFSLITRHDLYNEVAVGMQSLTDVLSGRDKSSAATLTLALREQLSHMRTTEDFRWENLF
jgi:1,4-alpha-glucan branching enzyme